MSDFDLATVTEGQFMRDEMAISITDYLSGVDNVLKVIEDTGNIELGLDVIKSLAASANAHGKALAKLLHGMNKMWKSSGDFTEYVAEFTHISPITVERYIDAWAAFESIPADYKERFLKRPMKDLNAIGAAISQGYEISDWDRVANTSNNNDLLRHIREDVKGVPPRSNSITIHIDKKTGDISCWANNIRFNIGYLNVQDMKTNPTVERAITRIIKSAGIIEE